MNITYGLKIESRLRRSQQHTERYSADSLKQICKIALTLNRTDNNLRYVGFWINYPVEGTMRSEVFYEPFNNNSMKIFFDAEMLTITGLTEFCNVITNVQPDFYPLLPLQGIRKETGDFFKRTFIYYQNLTLTPFYKHVDYRALNFIYGRGTSSLMPKKQAVKINWQTEGF